MASSETFLFTIEIGSSQWDSVEKVLKPVDCYLVPTAVRGRAAVACSARYAPRADEVSRLASDALAGIVGLTWTRRL